MGESVACAMTDDLELYCAGYNKDYGDVGTGDLAFSSTPVLMKV